MHLCQEWTTIFLRSENSFIGIPEMQQNVRSLLSEFLSVVDHSYIGKLLRKKTSKVIKIELKICFYIFSTTVCMPSWATQFIVKLLCQCQIAIWRDFSLSGIFTTWKSFKIFPRIWYIRINKRPTIWLYFTLTSKPALITARRQFEGFNTFKTNVLNSQIYCHS